MWWWKKNAGSAAQRRIEGFDPKIAKFNLWPGVFLHSFVGFISLRSSVSAAVLLCSYDDVHPRLPDHHRGVTATSTFVLDDQCADRHGKPRDAGHILRVPAIAVGVGAIVGAQIGGSREEEQAETDPEAPLFSRCACWYQLTLPRDLDDCTFTDSTRKALPGFPGIFIRLPEVIYITLPPFRAAHHRNHLGGASHRPRIDLSEQL